MVCGKKQGGTCILHENEALLVRKGVEGFTRHRASQLPTATLCSTGQHARHLRFARRARPSWSEMGSDGKGLSPRAGPGGAGSGLGPGPGPGRVRAGLGRGRAGLGRAGSPDPGWEPGSGQIWASEGLLAGSGAGPGWEAEMGPIWPDFGWILGLGKKTLFSARSPEKKPVFYPPGVLVGIPPIL